MLAPMLPPDGFRCIVVEDLRLRIFIGVLDEERQARQEVSITLHMLVRDLGPYADVVAKLRERANATHHVNLVETLAEEAAQFALAEPRVESVIVHVGKTEIIAEAKSVGVIIHRRRRPPR
jgi:FolB domain-containing protein